MQQDRYPVTISDDYTVYQFVSIGIKGEVPKMVIYGATDLKNFFNLGFGDKNSETGEIDDIVVTNNGDSEKVLATVAGTLFDFTKVYPKAMIFATGSTKSRTRLYRMSIHKFLDEITKSFTIYGLTANNEWQVFESNMDYKAFLIIRKDLSLNYETE